MAGGLTASYKKETRTFRAAMGHMRTLTVLASNLVTAEIILSRLLPATSVMSPSNGHGVSELRKRCHRVRIVASQFEGDYTTE